MKRYRYKDPSQPIYHYHTTRIVEIPEHTVPKPFLAMWVSNVLNIDLPSLKDLDAYQKRVQDMIQTALDFQLTALFFQVRTTNDAFYASKLNPYSRYLVEKEGNIPPFDVLRWVIQRVHEAGLEFHAWCNPYRVSMASGPKGYAYLETCDDLNFAKKYPEHTLMDLNGQLILNPSHEASKKHIIDSMLEIVRDYPVDGINFDDYFYPYAGLDPTHDDAKDYENRFDRSQSLGDFRRHHVNDLIKRLSEAFQQERPIRFGISPFGIYKNKVGDSIGSNTDIKCSQSYDNQYADALVWVEQGWIDYIVPQIYWDLGHPIAPFADVCDFWADLCSRSHVDLYIGHAAYRLGQEGEYENPEEINDQIRYAAQYPSVKGHVFFTFKSLFDDPVCQTGVKRLNAFIKGETRT